VLYGHERNSVSWYEVNVIPILHRFILYYIYVYIYIYIGNVQGKIIIQ